MVGIDHCPKPTCSTCLYVFQFSFFMSFKYHVRVAQSKRSPLSTHVSNILAFIILDSQDPLSSSFTLAHRHPGHLILLFDVLLWSHLASQHADISAVSLPKHQLFFIVWECPLLKTCHFLRHSPDRCFHFLPVADDCRIISKEQ